MATFCLIAQATQEAPKGGPQGPWLMIGYIVIIMVIFWMIMFRPRAKEQKQREQMLGQMKKHDKVMTIGGIIGTVMEVRENEVIVKVDDNTNARMKFAPQCDSANHDRDRRRKERLGSEESTPAHAYSEKSYKRFVDIFLNTKLSFISFIN